MKGGFLPFVLALALLAPGIACAGERIVETLQSDIDHDGKPDTLVLSADDDDLEAGAFTHIAIQLGSGGHFDLTATTQWVPWDADAERGRVIARETTNILHSRRLLLVDAIEGDRLLLATGFARGTKSEAVTVWRVSRTGIQHVFEGPMLMTRIWDIDRDGHTDIVGSMTPEALGANCQTYDPDVVYTLHDVFGFNRALTERNDRSTDGFYESDHAKFFVLTRGDGVRVLLPLARRAACDTRVNDVPVVVDIYALAHRMGAYLTRRVSVRACATAVIEGAFIAPCGGRSWRTIVPVDFDDDELSRAGGPFRNGMRGEFIGVVTKELFGDFGRPPSDHDVFKIERIRDTHRDRRISPRRAHSAKTAP